MSRLRSPKFWLKLLAWITGISLVLFFSVLALVYWKQEAVVQEALRRFNSSMQGRIEIAGSHISPFANFPYISIDLEELRIYENKEASTKPILQAQDCYLGFDFWLIYVGNYDIKTIRIDEGDMYIVQDQAGDFNIVKAFSSQEEAQPSGEESEPLDIHLQSIVLNNIDLHKINKQTGTELEFFIYEAQSSYQNTGDDLKITLDSRFELNLIQEGDTSSFVKHKNFDVQTVMHYKAEEQMLIFEPSKVVLGDARFTLEGSIDLDDKLNLDLKVESVKPNFDMFIAFAPEELLPTLKSYGNRGEVFLNATIQGQATEGMMPAIEAHFGCKNGLISNTSTKKELHDMAFTGYFSNGTKRDMSTMEFRLKDFQAKPDAGIFSGDLRVYNFESPEIDLKLRSEFNLDFLEKFFNIKNLEDVDGYISLTMNFRDIIDLNNPEKSIERLNESYYTELLVKDLGFRSTAYYLPLKNINIKATMEGHEAKIEYLNAELGDSDISIKGSISDLPAIIHHSNQEVQTDLLIESNLLNFKQITYNDSLQKSSSSEQIRDLKLNLAFLSTARAFTESPNLPVGEFIIRNFEAKLKNYPHHLHDIHADVFIQDEDIRLADFSGAIDGSDFHFSGKLTHYDYLMKTEKTGDSRFEFDLRSKMLRLEDLFSYEGQNYVPEDYRHEEFDDLKLHGRVDFHLKDSGLQSIDMYLDKLSAKMKLHQARFDNFNGRIHYEAEQLTIEELSGQIGRSDLKCSLNYYLGADASLSKKSNMLLLESRRLDIDQLLLYDAGQEIEKPADHDAVFNIFELPFTDMRFDVNIGDLLYHRYHLRNLNCKMRTQANHYIYLDQCSFDAAGGSADLKGYFNGSNPKEIYFSPDIAIENMDLDQILFKFENFGQDHIISENLHGRISAELKGKVLMHADLTPIIDQSKLSLLVEITNGRLDNYKPILAMSEYFQEKNLNSIRFDTLRNEFEIDKGKMTIPWMTINSSIGFLQISGSQDMDFNMSYFIKVPLKMVGKIAFQKLFKRKQEEVDLDQVDEVEYLDPEKKIRYLNIKIEGNADNYKISLGKDKSEHKQRRELRREARRQRRAERRAQ